MATEMTGYGVDDQATIPNRGHYILTSSKVHPAS